MTHHDEERFVIGGSFVIGERRDWSDLRRSRQRFFLQEFAKLLSGQARVPHDPTQGKCFDRIVSRDRDLTIAVAHHNVLALPDDLEPCLFQGADRIQMVNAGYSGHGYTCTSISRTSAPWKRSSNAARYSRMASRMLVSASSSVSPSDQQPGKAGTDTLIPSSVW